MDVKQWGSFTKLGSHRFSWFENWWTVADWIDIDNGRLLRVSWQPYGIVGRGHKELICQYRYLWSFIYFDIDWCEQLSFYIDVQLCKSSLGCFEFELMVMSEVQLRAGLKVFCLMFSGIRVSIYQVLVWYNVVVD